jgi:poly [ADP-ribose] polymerase
MTGIIDQRMLMLTDATNNNNKFYEATLHDTGVCVYRFGRVGATGQTKVVAGAGSAGMAAKIAEKEAKGYRQITVLGKASSGEAVSKTQLKVVAQQELAGKDPVLKALVERLAEANRHQIMLASGGQMDLDLSTGIISTPLGVVTLDNVDKGRKLLEQMAPFVLTHDYENRTFVQGLNDYLMLIPQKVPHARGWHREFLSGAPDMIKQSTLLDQLATSVDLVTKQIAAGVPGDKAPAPVFDVKMSLVEDPKVLRAIEAFFKKGINLRHESRHLKPVKVYEVSLGAMARAYESDGAKLTNIQRLWHGTRVFNVLSILKSGLIIPRNTGTFHITGRMFGDGLYFSDQATKSLNYSYGYWDAGQRDNQCFMFLADVAMGNMHTPRSSSERLPASGSDSTFAKAGESGIQNNEMIVYRTGQANLRYLVEFHG